MKSKLRISAAAVVIGLTGAANAANLVPNGDFEAGATGFTSDYTQVSGAPNSLYPESAYYVGTNPYLYHNLFTSYGDHTSGSGNMLIVNGASDTSKVVWETVATISVDPNSTYFFEAWISSAYPDSPAMLSFLLDGDISDFNLGTGTAPGITGEWEPLSFMWDSGANTSVTLKLQNANPASHGNDFAVDDIYLGETSSVQPVPEASTSLSILGLVAAAGYQAIRRRRA